MSECRAIFGVVYPYLDGELVASKAEEVRAHLDACPACRETFSRDEAFLAFCRSVASPPGNLDRLRRSILGLISGEGKWGPVKFAGDGEGRDAHSLEANETPRIPREIGSSIKRAQSFGRTKC